MQRDDILEFLGKIDEHLESKHQSELSGKKFELKIFGKSALMLARLTDSIGTNDIDILRVDGQVASDAAPSVIKSLEAEFGRARIRVNGYYLEFVDPAIVFLAQKPKWVPVDSSYQCLSVKYLDPSHVIASKLFSTFSKTPRKQDKQDVRAALDQKLVTLKDVCEVADQVFDFYAMDSRSDRFPAVYEYIKSLMADYGEAALEFRPAN